MAQKGELHIRNKHNGQYDFPLLIENYPPLKRFVSLNPLGVQTINFFNPQAVKALNKALLISYYGIRYWDIPKQYLCPPIPGRADYIHYIADLIQPDRVAKDLQAEEEDCCERTENETQMSGCWGRCKLYLSDYRAHRIWMDICGQ